MADSALCYASSFSRLMASEQRLGSLQELIRSSSIGEVATRERISTAERPTAAISGMVFGVSEGETGSASAEVSLKIAEFRGIKGSRLGVYCRKFQEPMEIPNDFRVPNL